MPVRVRIAWLAVSLFCLIGIGAERVSGQAHTIAVAGLDQPVEVIRDRWGINHIYAQTEHDLFFAQGYAAAKDRLFQFELWRRQATGTVAEVLGKRELQRDIGARLHQFRGDLESELKWYHPRGPEIIRAFVDGVNTYIGETERQPQLLPLEFKMLGLKPGRWTPDVVISRHNGLLGNLNQEIDMARAVHLLGVERVKALTFFQGGDPVISLDPAIDATEINDNLIALYRAFRDPLRFVPEQIAADYRAESAAVAVADNAQLERDAADEAPRPEDIGSNNWVVSGTLTSSGKPMMMNDPHRVIAAPSLRYWVHLVGPGWNVIGGGEPVLPGVSIGHNEQGAWGLTIFGNDSEDLYVYETNPANPNQYRYRGGWEDMRVVTDKVPVKGEAAVSVELKYTRHGPVLFEDKTRRRAYALRAAWLEIGSAPYLASLRMNQARTWEEFRDACEFSRIPAENMVWADVEGHIGWQAAGIQPLRPNWSGLVPVPGDGRYEWDGYLPIKALPNVSDPPRGFIVTANNYLFPEGYPHKDALHFTWADPYRASRITEVLAEGRMNTVADMARLQNDDLSIPARSLVPLLRDLDFANATSARARDTLLTWNFVLDKSSIPAGIYGMWQRRLLANMRTLLVPKDAQDAVSLSMKRVIDWLHAPDGRFGTNPTAARDELLVRSLDEAVAELTKKLGADMNEWRWGQDKYHHALIRHPLAEVVKPDIRAQLKVGPFPRGGDSYTPTATGAGDNQTSGGSLKLIADTSNWDNSVGQNTPGQSGDPASPFYRDLFELWAKGRYFTVAYSRGVVESVAAERTLMQPSTNTRPTAGKP